MQTSLLLPLILIATTHPDANSGAASAEQGAVAVADFLDGCRHPVLDTRESSRILFQTRLDALDEVFRTGLPDRVNEPLFIARCGQDFVLFNRRMARDEQSGDQSGDVLYLRFEEGTFALLQEHWG